VNNQKKYSDNGQHSNCTCIRRADWKIANLNCAKKNLKKHSVSFDEAVTVFYDPLSATFVKKRDIPYSFEETTND